MDKLISIILPCYKVEKFLDNCLKTLINQTYKNLEIILVDDGSPDNSPKVCDEWAKKDKRIKVVHKENGGVSSARNKGLEVANGDYIGFVDPDDYVDLTMYEKLINSANENNSDVVYCGYNEDIEGKIVPIEEYNLHKLTDYDVSVYFYKKKNTLVYGSIWRGIYRKSLIKDIKFDVNFKCGEDLYFNIEVNNKKPKISIVDEKLYYYLKNPNSCVNTYRPKDYKNVIVQSDKATSLIKDEKILNFIRFNDTIALIADYLQYNKPKKVGKTLGLKNLKKFLSFKNYINFIPKVNFKRNILTILILLKQYWLVHLYLKN